MCETNKTKKAMALNIKAAIAMRGLTATQVAKRMGISVSTLSAIINGNPVLSSLEGVAKALRCDIAELFDRPASWTKESKKVKK